MSDSNPVDETTKPMTQQQQHPITPPPELVQQLWDELRRSPENSVDSAIAWTHCVTHAARWGADAELEACCKWLDYYLPGYDACSFSLRAARRPKPPSLKEQALETLKYAKDLWSQVEVDTIRRALEALPDD